MNKNFIKYVLSTMFKLIAGLLIVPLILSLIYKEEQKVILSFLYTIILLLISSAILNSKDKNNLSQKFYSREGFLIVALSWIFLSFFGALPFYFSSYIPSLNDAFFETVSGFTTTGATILNDIEILPKSLLFWRSLTHFVGGMGVLVLVLAILPKGNSQSMHILRAEVPGPSVGKLVAKMSYNSRILYIIYITLTIFLIILLYFSGMPLFDSIIHSFGTAGTGGYSSKNLSIAYYNSPLIEYILAFAMLIYGLNFNIFYLIILGNIKQVFKSEEMKYYFLIVLFSTLFIAINIHNSYTNFEKLIRDSFFTVASIITTTGFSTTSFTTWPTFSQTILLTLMFIGGCAGSTAGGMKVSRVIVLVKDFFRQAKKISHPNLVKVIKLDGKTMEEDAISAIISYFTLYVGVFFIFFILISIDNLDFLTAFSAVATTFNNIGPGFGSLSSNFSDLSNFSKIVLSFSMLFGRLEILPMMIIFSRTIYKKIK